MTQVRSTLPHCYADAFAIVTVVYFVVLVLYIANLLYFADRHKQVSTRLHKFSACMAEHCSPFPPYFFSLHHLPAAKTSETRRVWHATLHSMAGDEWHTFTAIEYNRRRRKETMEKPTDKWRKFAQNIER